MTDGAIHAMQGKLNKKATLQLQMSVHLSQKQKPLSLSEWLLFGHQAYQPSSLSTIELREVIIQKKKVVNFHNFGPDPPLKVVKPQFFFFTP